MQQPERSAQVFRELRGLGVRLAIDDFGTGYSSLSYLRKLPADILKIDQSFLHEAEFGSATLPLIQTIVALAHNMGMTVTAEGVENELQLELVRRAKCDRVQGHLFGQSLKPGTVDQLLRQSERIVAKAGR